MLLGTHVLRRARATTVSACKMAINIAVEAGDSIRSLAAITLIAVEEKIVGILIVGI